jgi:3-carboxy-cis,cis-muconate cycloisomerase
LPEPTAPWHAYRFPFADLAAALDLVANACAKIAVDIQLLAQTEVGEVRESTDGRSSTMPHKRNPVAATLARACAVGAHAAAGILTGGVHEQERAGGAWHAEWRALSDELALSGGAADWVRTSLDGLEVDAERMRANIRAETLSEAHRLGDGAIDPEDYLGAANDLIERALALYRG